MAPIQTGYPSTAYANYGLLLLWAIYMQNQWSRYILNYLYAEPYDDKDDEADYISIAAADSLTTADYGLLTGYGFSATFVVTGLFMGRAADTYNRKYIITAGCYIWNLALMGMGMSSAFWQLLCWRLLLGFGQAFSNPSSYSMIADMYPPEKRAQANGIFASGVYIGGGMASISMSIALGIGWRNTCYLTAVIGAGLATALFVTYREPTRQMKEAKRAAGEEKTPDMSAGEAMKLILTTPKVVVLLTAASVRYMGGYAISGYLPDMYDYVFSNYTTQYSYINAYVVAFGGFMSSWAGGKITTMWLESGQAKANYYVPMIGCIVACPFMAICCLSSNFYVSILVGLLGEYLTAECWFGPFMSCLQSSLPPRARGMGVATMMFTATFFGSLMSYLMGVVYDAMVDGGAADTCVRYIVLYSVLGTYLISAYLFYMGANMLDVEDKAAERSPLLADEESAESKAES